MPANHRPRRASRKAAARTTRINLMIARTFAARKAIRRSWSRSVRRDLRYSAIYLRSLQLENLCRKRLIGRLMDEFGVSQATVYAALSHIPKSLRPRKTQTIHIFPR